MDFLYGHILLNFDYDPDTGLFKAKKSQGKKVRIGDFVGHRDEKGYVRLSINGKTYAAHRIAWLYVHGKMPDHEIDHINGIRHDNRIKNLREATDQINAQNLHWAKANNSTKQLGVSKHHNGKYRAIIHTNGDRKIIGVFNSPRYAHQKYLEEKRKSHEGCTI